MPRIKGVDIPGEKRIEASLRYIYGIGPTMSRKVLDRAGVFPNVRAKELTDEDVAKINAAIVAMEIPVEGELKRLITQNVRRLQEIKAYRGLRHLAGLPVRGQRTRTNSRTRKGKRKTVGGQKKKLAKK